MITEESDQQLEDSEKNSAHIQEAVEQTTNHVNGQSVNNSRHIVAIGVVFVLLTLTFATTILLRCARADIKQPAVEQTESNVLIEESQTQQSQNPNKITANSLENESTCQRWSVFTNHINSKDETAIEEQLNNKSGIANNSNRSQKFTTHKRGNVKNGSNRHRSSVGVNTKKKKEKKEESKKSSTTAEPIIYLFALVFIYLLLKAASDINQHYKSQTKGDKRLRRCSLQSYAQTHKQDRRASKGITAKNLPKFQALLKN